MGAGTGIPSAISAFDGVPEGFEERCGRYCHEGAEQKNNEAVRAEFGGGKIDERRNANGKYTEHAKDSDRDPAKSHHLGLDVGKLR